MKRLIITLISFNGFCLFSHSSNWEGLGSKDNPYIISSPRQLADIAEEVNSGRSFEDEYFSLTNDIDLSEICGEDLKNWISIGTATQYFEGTFWGNNHTISNLYIAKKVNDTYYEGLFGFIGENGSVHDLTLENGYVYASFWSGGIAGANNGFITNCRNINCKINSWMFSGGICGVNFNTIENCINEAEVNSNLSSGGICSYNYGYISMSSNLGEITANEASGGICGYNGGFGDFTNCRETKIGLIDKCHNRSSIVGQTVIGGITGRNDGFIVNSMNSGNITGAQKAGGLAGSNGGFDGVIGNISNSFNIGIILGRDTLIGGIIGYGNQASELNNVYTNDNVICVNTITTQYIGEENGSAENCYLLDLKNETTLDSITDKLNQWVNSQSDPDLYLKWGHNDKSIYPLTEDYSEPFFAIGNDPFTMAINSKSQEEIKIFSAKGKFFIISPIKQDIHVFSIDGKVVRKLKLNENTVKCVLMEKGIYIAKGKKIVVY